MVEFMNMVSIIAAIVKAQANMVIGNVANSCCCCYCSLLFNRFNYISRCIPFTYCYDLKIIKIYLDYKLIAAEIAYFILLGEVNFTMRKKETLLISILYHKQLTKRKVDKHSLYVC